MTDLVQLVAGLALLALAAATAVFRRDAAHPGVLVTTLWGLLLTLFQVLPHSMSPVSMSTTLVVLGGATMFWAGSILVEDGDTVPFPRDRWKPTFMRPTFFWFALLGLPVYVLRALEVAESANLTELWFVNLRIALSFDEDGFLTYGVLAYLVPVAFASTLVELACSRSKLFERRGWIVFAASIGYAVLSTGRTYLLLLLVSVAFVILIQRRATARQILYAGVLGIIAVFFGVGVLANKVAVDVIEGVNKTPVDALALYLFSPLSALDVVFSAGMKLDWGLNVFRSPLAVLRALGADATVVPLVKEYVFVPDPTNVYTVYLPYLQDFGVPGAMAAMLMLGAAQAYLYARSKTQDPRLVIAFALSVYPLSMQFFQDQYFSLLTTWIVYAVLVGLSFRSPDSGRP